MPLIVGGSGPRRTPEIAARFAAEFNSGWESPERTAAEFARMADACRRTGRDPASMRMSTVQTLDDALDHFEQFCATGADRIYLELLDLHDLDQVHRAAEQLLHRSAR